MLDLKGKTVTILGLGQFEHGSGLAAVKYALAAGANLIITDLKSEQDLAVQIERVKEYMQEIKYKGHVEWVMGQHRDQDMTRVDMIIRNPGVPIASPFLQKARNAGVPVESEMTLFFKMCNAKTVGITGTRGKSTTTAMVAHVLQAGKARVWWGGNIGKRSPLEFVGEVKRDDVVVLELSSWMLESLHEQRLSPQIGVILNVQEDHLNRYADMDAYAEAKWYLTAHQKPEDTVILNHANAYTQAMAKRTEAQVIWFDREQALEGGYFLKGSLIMRRQAGKDEEIIDTRQVRLLGQHNQENMLAAVACAMACGLTAEQIRQQLPTFTPLPGRLQFVDEVKGVTFVNDTTATTPSATLAALQALHGRPMILIIGGSDKQLPFDVLAKTLPSHVKALVWLPGTGTDRLRPLLPAMKQPQATAASMSEAVSLAFSQAAPGDLIVLSPACASFGLFKNEFDRGDQFNAAVQALAARFH